MDPRHAVIAAKLFGAAELVPIHYGPLHAGDNYVQAEDPPGTLRSASRELGVAARVLEPGEKLRLQPRSTQSEP